MRARVVRSSGAMTVAVVTCASDVRKFAGTTGMPIEPGYEGAHAMLLDLPDRHHFDDAGAYEAHLA